MDTAEFLPSLKRERDLLSEEPEGYEDKSQSDDLQIRRAQSEELTSGLQQFTQHRNKRPRHTVDDLGNQYLIVHCVKCRRGGTHKHHEQTVFYLDAPRLFAGDSKASALRGRRRIDDIEELLEERADLSFLVYRTYSCKDYHQLCKDSFRRLPTPKVDRKALAGIRAYFFSLDVDGDLAEPQLEHIDIIAKDLEDAIQDLKARYPDHFRDWSSRLSAPYSEFYHCRNIWADYAIENSSEFAQQAAEHVRALFQYVSLQNQNEWEEADEFFIAGEVSRSHFSKLFGPNEVIVTMSENHPMAYVSNMALDMGSKIQLDCWSWEYNGAFYKQLTTLAVSWPSDQNRVPIVNLRVYPLRYDTTGLKGRLQNRGEEFWTCRHRKFVSYSVPKSKFEIQIANPRYMIDAAMYRQMHEGESAQRDDLGPAAMKRETPPPEPFCLLLPHSIRGYGMHDKKWSSLKIEFLRAVEWNERAFGRLVLDHKKKELIKALITVHINSSNTKTTDIIEGKGKGLIVLLHGGPGTGKTLTAESVAELAKRPLYRVTCGDIGTEPEAVEKYLESVLYIGTAWSCVVLLDEADVFLEERTQTDLQRNALVSVFLRVLEYYEGILILTSNRVGLFDEAFMSRVQLALHYPSLDEQGRFEIWDSFLHTLNEEVKKINYKELREKLHALAHRRLNGRQIRNTVNTARQLAHFKNEVLGYSHFHQAIEVAEEFQEYVEKTHGHTDEEYAKAQRLRYR